MKVTKYEQGMPNWVDLSTTDEAGALEFYSALFGWKDEPNDAGDGMVYHMQKLGDDYSSAITAQRPDEVQQGVPSHWVTYISVDDVDAVAARVTSAGGQLIAEAFDVMDAGRMAVVADPTGGFVNLWQAKGHIGCGIIHEANALTWSELMTLEPAKAAAFFEELLGLTSSEAPGTDGAPYTLLSLDDEPVAGILQITPEMGEMPPNWMTYFEVADLEAAVERATSLGAQSPMPIMDAPGMRFAVIEDPQGAVFGLMAPSGLD